MRFSTSMHLLATAFVVLMPALGLAQDDREALKALYESTGGDDWADHSGWKTDPVLADGFNDDPCSEPLWFGVVCEGGRVVEIGLSQNNLIGTLPSALGTLSDLRELNLGSNELSGPIPPGLGNLSQLTVLQLPRNRLSGSVPPQLGALANLVTLSLFANQLSGTIPPEIGGLNSLEVLFLQGNQFHGSIPGELGALTSLSTLSLNSNFLSGPIPPQLGQLANLSVLGLGDNRLGGSIPPELGNLEQLQLMSVINNHLSGMVPSSIAEMGENTLDLRNNRLAGVENGLSQQLDLAQRGEARWESLQNVAGVYPQFVVGGGFRVILAVSNPTLQNWTGTVFLSGGLWPEETAWQMDGVDMTGQSSFSIELGPLAAKRIVLSSPGPAATGWLSLRAEGDSRPEDVAPAFFFNLSGQEGLIDSTGVAPASFVENAVFPVERSAGVDTGIALRGVTGEPLFMFLRDEEGNLLQFVAVEEDQARLLGEIFAAAPDDFRGTVLVSGSHVALTVLRLEIQSDGGVQLTSIPATG